jgi:anti-anti-sigma regulatory factor
MPTTRQTTTEDSVVVTRVGESVWILRPIETLASRAVAVLRDTFLEAVDSGAQNVVIDLSEVDTIAAEGASTLLAMADLMLGRNGSLWIADRWPEGAGPTLRPIEEHGPRALLGVSAVLDAALERLSPDISDDRPAGNGR